MTVYALSGGTSNAASIVTGVAALALSVRPDLSAHELKEILLGSAMPLQGLQGKIASGGVVNAYRALTTARDWKQR